MIISAASGSRQMVRASPIAASFATSGSGSSSRSVKSGPIIETGSCAADADAAAAALTRPSSWRNIVRKKSAGSRS
ncbi:hypothetical protein E1287_30930 [Actinomadura sp. KC06]|uniref:hypothetical protein n=1 Tax=Actinomadura sp. KC06 TaxID=2530369 RepID=UPI0010498777|nr:hypothetical protein [Actinomadura sp. KC06]TDD29478.1 hypothetical protein E1287_30930 [Actinomadura sp. KC06]